MNAARKIQTAAERRRVFYTLLAAGFVLASLSLLCLELWRRRVAAETHVRMAEAEVLSTRGTFPQFPAGPLLKKAMAQRDRLMMEWENLRSRTDTFKGQSPLTQALSPDEEGRIDFKVALFEARSRLQEKAASKGIAVPSDLGMDETIGTDERAETRLKQLASVVRLVDTCYQQGVPAIESIVPLPPLEVPLLEEENAVAQEFPVHIKLRCPYDTLMSLLNTLAAEDAFFSLRRFWVEKTEQEDESLLVDLVCGAMLFQLRQEGDAVITSGSEAGR